MVVLYVYVYLAIFLLFYDNPETEYESCEIETSISQLISTH